MAKGKNRGGIDHAAEQAAVDEVQHEMNSHDGENGDGSAGDSFDPTATAIEQAAQPSAAHADNGKPKESKADRFKRLANRRVPKMVKAMNVVANLANKAQYEYTDEQRTKLLALAEDACKRLRSAFGPKESAPAEALLF